MLSKKIDGANCRNHRRKIPVYPLPITIKVSVGDISFYYKKNSLRQVPVAGIVEQT